MARLLSLAAGVQIDVAPADMVTVAHDAGWPAVGIWFDGKTWTNETSREVRQRLDDTGVIALDIEPIIPSEDGSDFAEQLIEAAAVIGARHILFTSRLKDQVRTTDRYQQVCEMARPHGIKVGAICPGGVKTEFALGKGRTEESVTQSNMLEPEDVAGAILLACTQSSGSRIIEIQMRTMGEALT